MSDPLEQNTSSEPIDQLIDLLYYGWGEEGPAAEKARVRRVKDLLSAGLDPNTVSATGKGLLDHHLAREVGLNGSMQQAWRAVFDAGFDPLLQLQSLPGTTPFLMHQMEQELVSRELAGNPMRSAMGDNLFHALAQAPPMRLTDLLESRVAHPLEEKWLLEGRASDGATVLHLMFSPGGFVEDVAKQRQTDKQRAMRGVWRAWDLVERLLEKGARLDAIDHQGVMVAERMADMERKGLTRTDTGEAFWGTIEALLAARELETGTAPSLSSKARRL